MPFISSWQKNLSICLPQTFVASTLLPNNSTHYMDQESDRKFAAAHGLAQHILSDPSGKVGHLYGAATTPHMFVIDADGVLVYMGGIDDRPTADPADVPGATNHVRAAIAELDAGQPVSRSVTRPYGCSIKY